MLTASGKNIDFLVPLFLDLRLNIKFKFYNKCYRFYSIFRKICFMVGKTMKMKEK